MKTTFGLLVAWAVSAPALCNYPAGTVFDYRGEFNLVSSTGEPCGEVFRELSYRTRAYVLGQTGRNVAIHFAGDQKKGFFHNLTFLSLLGPDCDYAATKRLEAQGVTYQVRVAGISDRELHVSQVSVEGIREGVVVCKAKAEYTGFW